MEHTESLDPVFKQGEPAPAEYFTGRVWVTPLVQPGGDIAYNIANVMFDAGARTNWHTHPAGQILLVLSGQGFYQEKGQPARPLHKGDVVNIPANMEHWHGATAKTPLVHVAISNLKDGKVVTWLQPVSGPEYQSVNT